MTASLPLSLPALFHSKDYGALKPLHYLDVYEQYFSRIRYNKLKIMEIGIAKGGSLKLWRDYFPNSAIYGIDAKKSPKLGPQINTFQCYQSNTDGMQAIARAHGPFDIVIDDGAHLGKASLNTFLAFFDSVVPGGLYSIEDWGTGYWAHWPDGQEIANEGNFTYQGKNFPSHQSGMVGFIKQLIDVCNTLDRTQGRECSQINSMEIMPGMALLRKRSST